ncbi:peptidyl-tRNA hydrolase domain-containing protein [Choiromyces venosus 120613-1]|uniref:Peptidyl-tRNA hydrolase domain-containing protein n=1 Tax=Choiromyces venosus 120613-1 TaxID=1336337 RepID=A0A3N4J8W4_9PEZI|nr:peptidyl-tRNA hydrolase domain-containing protein [Choiromyces venosus 120613-1]
MFLIRRPTVFAWPTEVRITIALWRTYKTSSGEEEEQIKQKRKWLAEFIPESIPRKNCDVSFSRASGPGGQNVNKVNSKVTLRLNLSTKGDFIPPYILEEVLKKSKYMTNNDEIVIQSDSSRKQAENIENCYRKLYTSIRECIQVPGETSEDTKKRIEKLEKAGKEKRLKEKKVNSSKKAFRKGGNEY